MAKPSAARVSFRDALAHGFAHLIARGIYGIGILVAFIVILRLL